jgi:hypothetical protein
MVEEVDAAAMAAVARDVLNLPAMREQEEDEAFQSFFGASIHIVSILWNKLVPLIDLNGAHPKHLLWSLVFLKFIQQQLCFVKLLAGPIQKHTENGVGIF